MPTNNFKLFDENKANLLTDTEYANATQRLNGVQTGVASSQLNNKFAYQVSLVAYAIAQLMNVNGLDASDTLAVSAFVGNLQGALLQKVADKATTSEAAAGVLSNKYITPETMKAAALLLSGGVMNGILDMGNNRITNLGTPTASSDATTKAYVDGNFNDPLIGFTKICTLDGSNNVNINFSTNKLYEIIVKLTDCKIVANNNYNARIQFNTFYREETGLNISSTSFTNEEAISCLLHFYPVYLYNNYYVYFNSSQNTNAILANNKVYTQVYGRYFTYTGTIELYAKWFT